MISLLKGSKYLVSHETKTTAQGDVELNAGFEDVLPMCKVTGMYLARLQNCIN